MLDVDFSMGKRKVKSRTEEFNNFYQRVCSDHESKAPEDCCKEAVRKAAKEDS